MCIAPNKLADGTEVGCRECWQCCERKIDDWTGRCIAESKTALRTFSISLTYGRDDGDNVDHIRAALLTYSDVQKYFKRLRKSGYVVRYFAVGEYGSTKGRAHWHLIVFYYDNAGVIAERKLYNAEVEAGLRRGKPLPVPVSVVPEHEISTRGADGDLRDVRFSDLHWQHGHAVWEELLDGYDAAASRAVRYVCKYLLKDSQDDASQMLGPRLSKKPPLGDAWIRERAGRYVQQGLAPQDLFYSFPDVRAKDGQLKRFMLGGVSADNFLRYYVEALTGVPMPVWDKGTKAARLVYELELWQWIVLALSPRVRMPNSALVEEWLDALVGPLREAQEYREKVRDIVRKKYSDPVYGPGFNLNPRGVGNGEA